MEQKNPLTKNGKETFKRRIEPTGLSRRNRLGRELGGRRRGSGRGGLLGGDLLQLGSDQLRRIVVIVVSEQIERVRGGHLRKRGRVLEAGSEGLAETQSRDQWRDTNMILDESIAIKF